MPKAKRERRERTDHSHLIQQWCHTPEQRLYEGIRPCVLFGVTPGAHRESQGSLRAPMPDHPRCAGNCRPGGAQRRDTNDPGSDEDGAFHSHAV